ncbi:TonB-dependent receptor [Sphingopyxis sp.]|uniref:TonB-dependent receptor n=1 Tax=Sphingopyxis sp. TaxID=1908224 RepID=UPI00261C2619|nr:TonB-dependent receptor [Sphingopyxis sp.]MCW0196521.1 TonB-dependent receptor [Sphingopyxis sp.]
MGRLTHPFAAARQVRKSALLAGTAILLAATGAQAQDNVGGGANADDIVVTAMKREERLQDVGATIQALSAEGIRTARVAELKDLATQVPNVDIKETVPGALPTVTIRGIGLDDFSTVSSPAAGIYIDEIPLASPGLMSGNFFDLGRIEILKGPQGTLYGRNTTAGAVNIVSATPGDAFAAFAKASYGNFDSFDAEAMLNIPLSGNAQLRVSGKTIQQGKGYWTSSLLADGTAGRRDIGTRDIWLGRIQLALQPTDNLDILLKAEGERSRSEMGVPQFNGTYGIGTPFVPCAAVLQGRLDNADCTDAYGYRNSHASPYDGDWTGDFPYKVDQVNLTGKVRYSAGAFEITSITGYIDFSRLYHIDVDATPLQQFDYVEDEDVRQFTQELRVGYRDDLVDLVAGGFYSWDRVLGDNTNLLDDWPLLFLGAASGSGKTNYDQVTRSQALYADATWHIADKVDLITGLRFTHEKRRYAGGTTFITPSPLVGVNDTFIDDRISDDNVTGRIGLNVRPRDGLLLFASVSRGRKSGGFFSGFTNNDNQLLPYRPETITAYEIGVKSEFGRVVTLNASGFYYDYKDPQTFVRFIDPDTGLSVQKVGNVDSARVFGADIDLILRPVQGLMLSGGLGLLDTHLSSFATAAGTVPAGNRLPNAPATSFSGKARYEFGVTDRLRAAVQGDARYASRAFKEASNDPLIASGSYWLLNARVSLADEKSGWEIALWGRNLTKERYVVQGVDLATLGIVNRIYNAPRTYGVEVSFRY